MRKGFVLYLVFLSIIFASIFFVYGFSTSKARLAGYKPLSAATLLLDALKVYVELEVLTDSSAHLISVTGGALNKEAKKLLATTGEYTLMSHFNGEVYQASLLNSEGETAHEWHIPFEASGLLKPWHQAGLSPKNYTIHGMHLYPNGDLLLVVDYRVLIRIDKDSNLLWVNKENIHHSVTVDEEGNIWTFNRFLEHGSDAASSYQNGYYFDDQILKLADDGSRLQAWSITDLLIKNGYQGLLLGAHDSREFWNSDPLHANDINVLSEQQASAFPGAKGGNLLLSLRSISSLLVISLEDESIPWIMTGPMLRQHDPEVDKMGRLWVFDNRNAWPQENAGAVYMPEGQGFGGSRILSIDPVSRKVLWSSEENQSYSFFSSIMGRLQVLDDGNLLIVEPEGGRVFELDPLTNTIKEEFVNFIDDNNVGRMSDADRISASYIEFLH
jgi:hypothetical protein